MQQSCGNDQFADAVTARRARASDGFQAATGSCLFAGAEVSCAVGGFFHDRRVGEAAPDCPPVAISNRKAASQFAEIALFPNCVRHRRACFAMRPRPFMRLSRYFLPTLRETPREAEIVSHRLMLRAGMVRQQSAGIFSWLPLGLRVLNKIKRDHPRRAEPGRRRRDPDADDPVGGSVARIGALRSLWQGDAAHPGPTRARHAVRPDQRGDGDGYLPHLFALLQGSAPSISITSSGSSATRSARVSARCARANS